MIYIFGLIYTLLAVFVFIYEQEESVEKIKKGIKFCPECARKHNCISPYITQFTKNKIYIKCSGCGNIFSPNDDE